MGGSGRRPGDEAPLSPPPGNPAQSPPPRRPGSLRRTSSIDMWWPNGIGTAMHMAGRARDLLTDHGGAARVLAEDSMSAQVDVDRVITSISAHPERAELGALVGARGGGGLRRVIADAVPAESAGSTPLSLLLDDIAGASLIGGFAWLRHTDDFRHPPIGWSVRIEPPPGRQMVGICSGFRPGAASVNPDGTNIIGRHNVAAVPPLTDPDDPIGWHALTELPDVAMRRARRIDLWRQGDALMIEAMFRDSCRERDLTEAAVHEYRLEAEADLASGVLRRVYAEPRVLPYAECPAAAPNVSWLEGIELGAVRDKVLTMLSGVDCCTHLNDALRALADVPALFVKARL